MNNKLLKATIDSYKAQKSEALAHLDVLFKNSVGIGEHTDLIAEIKKWTEMPAASSTIRERGDCGARCLTPAQ